MAERAGLAAVALALGILGLFTAGGLGLGSVLGLALACIVLLGTPTRGSRNVAWAAIAANAFALLTLLPLSAALVAYRAVPIALFEDDDALPVPVQPYAFVEPEPAVPPPPPPPPPTQPPAAGGRSRREPDSGVSGSTGRRPPANARPTEDVPRAADGPPAAIRVGGSIAEPRKTRHVNPVYPKVAVQSRIQGVVVLECTISPTGKVVEVRTVRGTELLTEAAIEAVRQWEYTPTLLNGVAVPVIMTVTVNFKLG